MKQTIIAQQHTRYWPILARTLWCIMALLVAALITTCIIMAIAILHNPSIITICNNCDRTAASMRGVLNADPWFAGYALYTTILCIIFALSYFIVAAVLVWRKPDDWMALFASFTFVLMAAMFCNELLARPLFWSVLAAHIAYLGITCLFLFFCLFPTGKLTPWWTYCLAIVYLCYWGTYALYANPLTHFPLLNQITQYSLVASLALVQVYRYRRISDTVLRRQTRWVVFGACTTVVLYLTQQQFVRLIAPLLPLHFLAPLIAETLFFIALLLIPLSIGIAILRSRLWNIDLIIHRTLVYGALSACVVGLYILVVGGLGTLLQAQGNVVISLLATGLIAVLFHPLRERLQQAVNYLVYGERNDPYRVLSRLSQRLGTTLVPEAVLPTIVETLAQAFKLPYAAITLKQGEDLIPGAVYGQARQGETPLHLALTYQGEFLGELLLSTDTAGEAFPASDRHLLEDLARHAGVAVHSVRLSAAIKRSHEQLVLTREEERRRLRRDLHDGLGPQLASLMLMLTTVRKTLRRNPDAAEKMLTEAMSYTQEAISDIRRLVYGLRPPALDDLGLLAALQEDMRRYHASGITFTLSAPESLPPLPAAVEVACYRIAQEALTNVIKHAHAHHCTLRLSIAETLDLEVTDDGTGLPPTCANGIGLTSMRERARELGGTCTINTPPTGGTHVYAHLPLGQTPLAIPSPANSLGRGGRSPSSSNAHRRPIRLPSDQVGERPPSPEDDTARQPYLKQTDQRTNH